jgi:hypothetical protein
MLHRSAISVLGEASPETLRTLRGLIPNHYELDVQCAQAIPMDRPGNMDKADAVIQEIMDMAAL